MRLPTEQVIGEQGVSVHEGKIKVELRLPWYRSLPLSTVEIAEVNIDGNTIAQDEMTFELESIRYPLRTMEAQTEHVWYVLDSAYLYFTAPALSEGEHTLSVLMNLYPPYIKGLKRPVRNTESFSVIAEVQ